MGYYQTELIGYWESVKEALRQTNKNQCIIWATDNNAGIANPIGEKSPLKLAHGHMMRNLKRGDSKRLKYFFKYALSAMSTLYT